MPNSAFGFAAGVIFAGIRAGCYDSHVIWRAPSSCSYSSQCRSFLEMFAGPIGGRSHRAVRRAAGGARRAIRGAYVTSCSHRGRVRSAPLAWWCGPFAITAARSAAGYAGRERFASFSGVVGTVRGAACAVTSGAARPTNNQPLEWTGPGGTVLVNS